MKNKNNLNKKDKINKKDIIMSNNKNKWKNNKIKQKDKNYYSKNSKN